MNNSIDKINEMLWTNATIDAYKTLKNTDGWLKCPACNQHPRVWEYDFGRKAACQCGERYKPSGVSVEGAGDVFIRTGSFLEFKENELMDAWNQFINNKGNYFCELCKDEYLCDICYEKN